MVMGAGECGDLGGPGDVREVSALTADQWQQPSSKGYLSSSGYLSSRGYLSSQSYLCSRGYLSSRGWK